VVGTEIAYTCLDIFIHNQRVARIDHPAADSILHWLQRLDGEYVSKLVLMNPHGWLTMDIYDDGMLALCFCNNRLEVDSSEVISRQSAAIKVLRFIEPEDPVG
jgi:hypothetical protein